MDSKSTKSTVTNISLNCDENFLEDIYQSKINGSGGFNQSEKEYEIDPTRDFSNASDVDDDSDESYSDIEVLRGDSDGDELYRLEREIEEKKQVLKHKRNLLCDRLMSYKLMQFSATQDAANQYTVSATQNPFQTESKTQSVVDKKLDSGNSDCFEFPTNTEVSALLNEHEMSYGLSEESLLAMAIQASIDDMAKTQTAAKESELVNEGASSSGYSAKPQTESENQICLQPPKNKTDSSQNFRKPFTAINPLLLWNTQSDTENKNQCHEAVNIEEYDNSVNEDFIESERYVGDKGKRPLSGKYSYKKRSKPSKADSIEQPSGSDLHKDESSESEIIVVD